MRYYGTFVSKTAFWTVTGTSLFFLLSFLAPSVAAAHPIANTSCQATWSVPQGSYSTVNPVTASVSAPCSGSGAWEVDSCTSYSSFNGIPNVICNGAKAVLGPTTYSCSFPCSVTFFTQTFPQGKYQFRGVFNGGDTIQSFAVSNFLVTPEFPIGSLLAVIAPIAGLIGYSLVRKSHLGIKLN